MEVKAVLLDVNGTLFPVTAAAQAFSDLGLRPEQVEVRRVTASEQQRAWLPLVMC